MKSRLLGINYETGAVSGKCLIFAGYDAFEYNDWQRSDVMSVIEIFRAEMDFARQNGGFELIKRHKRAGYAPCSDLDHEPGKSTEDI